MSRKDSTPQLPSDSASQHKGERWGYTGAIGPTCWGGLDDAWRICADGQEQSPIALPAEATGDATFALDYHEGFGLREAWAHHAQMTLEPGSALLLDGHRFELVQFHFHAPGEHHFQGQPAAAEAHLVHADAEGAIAVIGIAIHASPQWEREPAWWQTFTEAANGTRLLVQPLDLLPTGTAFLQYTGSLTTPPCTEGVRWLMAAEPLRVAPAAIAWMTEALAGNARPIQPTNGRPVTAIYRR